MKIPPYSEKAGRSPFDSQMNRLSQMAEKVERDSASDQQLRKATQEFESLFLHYLMKTMRATIPKGDLFHGGMDEEIFTDLLDQEIASAASKRGVGIADLLYQQLRRTLK